MAGETILIVDDDADIREILTMYLANDGYHPVAATDGMQALSMLQKLNPDLIILDVMMPELDGIEACQELRKTTNAPIIFLSCRATPIDKSLGLVAGGDDYMSKPFDTIELLARVKAQLRRSRLPASSHPRSNGNPLCYLHLKINRDSHNVQISGQDVSLSPLEFRLLAFLAQNPGTVFSNEELYQALWGNESFGDYRTIMVHISNIRKKIESDPRSPVFIHTIKGVGYKFDPVQKSDC